MTAKKPIPDRTSRRIRAEIKNLSTQLDGLGAGNMMHSKELAMVSAKINKLLGSMDALHRLRAKQDQQLDRMVRIQWLMLKRMDRFYSEKVEPGVVDSIHRDLKTPTLLLTPGNPQPAA
jgi:hypothetical protein